MFYHTVVTGLFLSLSSWSTPQPASRTSVGSGATSTGRTSKNIQLLLAFSLFNVYSLFIILNYSLRDWFLSLILSRLYRETEEKCQFQKTCSQFLSLWFYLTVLLFTRGLNANANSPLHFGVVFSFHHQQFIQFLKALMCIHLHVCTTQMLHVLVLQMPFISFLSSHDWCMVISLHSSCFSLQSLSSGVRRQIQVDLSINIL